MTTRQRHAPEAIADFPARYATTARFTLGSARNVTVTGDGSRVVFCRSRSAEDPVLCLYALDVTTGAERLLVDPAELASGGGELPPEERARRERARESASGIVSYAIDADGDRCCFALGGALFVVDVATGAVQAPAVEGAVFDPRPSPDGTAVAYVDGRALRLWTVDGEGKGTAGDRELRADDDPLVSHGRAEFIAAEEMGRSRGFWWAPDGSCLLATRVDEKPVAEWWIADPAHPDRAPTPTRYPAAGTANATVGLEIVDLEGNARPVDWSDGGRYEYLADVAWQPGHEPLVVRQTRDQRLVSIARISIGPASVGARASAVTELHRIVDDVWVELMAGSPRLCSHGLLTLEDRDGRRRLMLDGQPMSDPEIDVRSIVGVSSAGEDDLAVVVSAWTEPTEVHLIAIPFGGTGRPITSEPGVHAAALDSTTIAVTSANPDEPGSRTTIHLLDLDPTTAPTGPELSPPLAEIADLSADPGFRAQPEFVELGPNRLPSAVFLPLGHNGSDPLPVLLDPYGGPHAQRVLKTHNAHLVSRWFAERGYAVIVTDGRGTPGRGPDWERAVWGDLAGPVLDDQVAALDAVLDRYPFLDRERVGIRGWSFGGYLAALAVLRRPDRFHAAVAGAPVTTWRLYDTHYTERYLGDPSTHPDHYDRSDLWVETDGGPQLGRLQRPLLLIHGLADDNVVAAHTLRFSTALLVTGSPHRVLPLSGVTHMTPQEAVAENLLRLQLDFLDETIGEGEGAG